MEQKRKRLYFTHSGLLIVMIASSVFPIGMNVLTVRTMVQDRLWFALFGTVMSFLSLFLVDASLFCLWRDKLADADRYRVEVRIPLLVVLGAAFIPVFTSVVSSPAILALHEMLPN